MTEINSKDLVIGQEYYDIPDLDLEYATVFEFVGHRNGEDIFKYVRGNKDYQLENDELIYCKPSEMYQP